MHLKLVVVTLVFTFVLSACNKNVEPTATYPDGLVGVWVMPGYGDSTITFKRSNSLIDQDYGLSFKTRSSLVERKNSGWCGTPPIHYADFDGTWTINDSIINITVGYWGGLAEYTWKLVSLDYDNLTIKRIEERYQH